MKQYRRPFRRSSFRSRGRTHMPKKSGRYQRGNIALAPLLDIATPNTQDYQVSPIAAIPNLVGDYADATGRALANRTRFIEVGGLVLDFQFIMEVHRTTTGFFNDAVNAYVQFLVFSDRLDDIGNPVALTSNWFTNTTPVNTETATETQDEDTRYPTRLHFRRAVALSASELQLSALVASNFPQNPVSVRTTGSANLRLRLRLDDEHALCLGWHIATDNAFPSEGFDVACRFMTIGSIYYRIVD